MARHLPVCCCCFVAACCFLLLPCFCAAGDEAFVFSGFSGAGENNLTFDGVAGVTGDGVLALTNSNADVMGHAFHRTPLQLKDKESPNGTVRSFSVTFVFAIVSNYSEFSTDGMAFLIAPTTDMSRASGAQYLGLLSSRSSNAAGSNNDSHIFAVELDTVQNTEFGDINNNHVGIDVDSLTSVQSLTAAFVDGRDGALKNLSLISGDAIQVWIDYDGQAKRINVTMAPEPQAAKPATPLLSCPYDLSTLLTNESYVGFSGATGPIRSQHCVLAWSFAVDGPAPPIDFASMPKQPSSSGGRKAPPRYILEIALPAAAALLIVLAAAVLAVRRKMAYAELREDWEVEFGPHRFSYKDLVHATEGFRSRNVLGAGGFGTVYKGVLPESRSEVAVKRVSHESSQGIKEFISEVVSIGHLRHRNLVQLLGYCRRKGELLLVYDYMPNGSLDKHLYGGPASGKPPLEWPQRFQIVKDVASGLFYLHEKWEQVVVHRDVKASNVLLDAAMNAHLSDFGLARLYDHGAALQTTRVVGTTGYMAPELARTGKASPLTDVFAFGTFLLEVACGRQPVCDTVRHGRKMLVDRVLEFWQRGAVLDTVDARLRGCYDAGEARLVLTLGLMCSHPFPSGRPVMRQVMQYLDGDAPLPELTPADLTLLSMMQEEDQEAAAFDEPAAGEYPWSGTSVGDNSMTSGISVGR